MWPWFRLSRDARTKKAAAAVSPTPPPTPPPPSSSPPPAIVKREEAELNVGKAGGGLTPPSQAPEDKFVDVVAKAGGGLTPPSQEPEDDFVDVELGLQKQQQQQQQNHQSPPPSALIVEPTAAGPREWFHRLLVVAGALSVVAVLAATAYLFWLMFHDCQRDDRVDPSLDSMIGLSRARAGNLESLVRLGMRQLQPHRPHPDGARPPRQPLDTLFSVFSFTHEPPLQGISHTGLKLQDLSIDDLTGAIADLANLELLNLFRNHLCGGGTMPDFVAGSGRTTSPAPSR